MYLTLQLRWRGPSDADDHGVSSALPRIPKQWWSTQVNDPNIDDNSVRNEDLIGNAIGGAAGTVLRIEARLHLVFWGTAAAFRTVRLGWLFYSGTSTGFDPDNVNNLSNEDRNAWGVLRSSRTVGVDADPDSHFRHGEAVEHVSSQGMTQFSGGSSALRLSWKVLTSPSDWDDYRVDFHASINVLVGDRS